ncbi:wd repeat-containing protein [Cyclospora cayetanensis]|uniref:Wd repeat-containing protein n=1 Tax=Cyclospora cayetanensis TaxID=88456 RepID=A0A1D3D6S4_9EIME|nr:wd repeat-containing protein [Cyclospora cayetanensis]
MASCDALGIYQERGVPLDCLGHPECARKWPHGSTLAGISPDALKERLHWLCRLFNAAFKTFAIALLVITCTMMAGTPPAKALRVLTCDKTVLMLGYQLLEGNPRKDHDRYAPLLLELRLRFPWWRLLPLLNLPGELTQEEFADLLSEIDKGFKNFVSRDPRDAFRRSLSVCGPRGSMDRIIIWLHERLKSDIGELLLRGKLGGLA